MADDMTYYFSSSTMRTKNNVSYSLDDLINYSSEERIIRDIYQPLFLDENVHLAGDRRYLSKITIDKNAKLFPIRSTESIDDFIDNKENFEKIFSDYDGFIVNGTTGLNNSKILPFRKDNNIVKKVETGKHISSAFFGNHYIVPSKIRYFDTTSIDVTEGLINPPSLAEIMESDQYKNIKKLYEETFIGKTADEASIITKNKEFREKLQGLFTDFQDYFSAPYKYNADALGIKIGFADINEEYIDNILFDQFTMREGALFNGELESNERIYSKRTVDEHIDDLFNGRYIDSLVSIDKDVNEAFYDHIYVNRYIDPNINLMAETPEAQKYLDSAIAKNLEPVSKISNEELSDMMHANASAPSVKNKSYYHGLLAYARPGDKDLMTHISDNLNNIISNPNIEIAASDYELGPIGIDIEGDILSSFRADTQSILNDDSTRKVTQFTNVMEAAQRPKAYHEIVMKNTKVKSMFVGRDFYNEHQEDVLELANKYDIEKIRILEHSSRAAADSNDYNPEIEIINSKEELEKYRKEHPKTEEPVEEIEQTTEEPKIEEPEPEEPKIEEPEEPNVEEPKIEELEDETIDIDESADDIADEYKHKPNSWMGQTAEDIADGKIPGENNEPSIIEKIQNPAEDININPEKLQELQEQHEEVLEEIKNNIDATSETSEKIAEESAEETLENTAKETTEESINDVAEEAVEDTASKMETKTVSDAAKDSIEAPSGNGLPTWAKIGIAAAGVIAVGSLIKNKDKKEKEAPRQNLNTKMSMHPMYSPSNYTNNDQQLAQGISRYRYGRTG